MSKTFTKKDVAEHKTEDQGIWIIVDDGVYDITSTSGASTVARRLVVASHEVLTQRRRLH